MTDRSKDEKFKYASLTALNDPEREDDGLYV
jgi:hypothetical protein